MHTSSSCILPLYYYPYDNPPMKTISPNLDNTLELDLFSSKIQAGFPTFSDDAIEGKLDLNTHLIKNPAASFYVRATGDSMTGAGIHPEDLLVVDRSVTPAHGKIVIAAIDGELTVKRLYKKDNVVRLDPENPKYQSIIIQDGADLVIWGVVIFVVHSTN